MEGSKIIHTSNVVFRKIVKTCSGIAVVAIFALIIIQVFFRYVLKTSMGGIEELPTYVMAIACWLSVPVAAMEDNHTNIDLIPNMFTGRARVLWTMWAELIEFITMAFFTKLAWDYCLHMVEGGTVTGGTGIPMWIFYAFIVLGSALCALFGIGNFCINLRRVINWETH